MDLRVAKVRRGELEFQSEHTPLLCHLGAIEKNVLLPPSQIICHLEAIGKNILFSPSQIISHFKFYRFINFAMHLDMTYVHTLRNYESVRIKMTENFRTEGVNDPY